MVYEKHPCKVGKYNQNTTNLVYFTLINGLGFAGYTNLVAAMNFLPIDEEKYHEVKNSVGNIIINMSESETAAVYCQEI